MDATGADAGGPIPGPLRWETRHAGVPVAYPPAPRTDDAVQRVGPLEVPDPYQTLMSPGDPATIAFFRAQAELSAEWVAQHPEIAAIEARLRAMRAADHDVRLRRAPRALDGSPISGARPGGSHGQPPVVVTGPSGDERVLIDVDAECARRNLVFDGFRASEDGGFVVAGFSDEGRRSEHMVVRVADGAVLDSPPAHDQLCTRYVTDCRPIPGESAVALVTDNGLIRSDHVSGRREVLADWRDLGPTFGGRVLFSADGRHAVVSCVTRNDSKGHLMLLDRTTGGLTPIWTGRQISAEHPKTWVQFEPGQVVVAERDTGHLYTVSLDHPERRRTVVSSDVPDGQLTGVALGSYDVAVARRRDDGTREIATFDRATGALRSAIPVSRAGDIFDVALFEDGSITFRLDSPTSPRAEYRIEPGADTPQLIAQNTPAGLPPLAMEHRMGTSADGTAVPYILLHRADITPGDVPRAAQVRVYGGHRMPTVTSFQNDEALLAADGYLVAIALVRGGADFDHAWADAGIADMQLSMEDTEAIPRDLVASGLSAPGKIAVTGKSHGGLVAAGAGRRAKDIVSTVAVHAPPADPLELYVPDYGSLDRVDDVARLLAASPYHRAAVPELFAPEAGDGPSIFVTFGEKDRRVATGVIGKWIAAEQARAPGVLCLGYGDPRADHFDTTGARPDAATAARLAFVADQVGAPLTGPDPSIVAPSPDRDRTQSAGHQSVTSLGGGEPTTAPRAASDARHADPATWATPAGPAPGGPAPPDVPAHPDVPAQAHVARGLPHESPPGRSSGTVSIPMPASRVPVDPQPLTPSPAGPVF